MSSLSPPDDAGFPAAAAPRLETLPELDATLGTCRACPRLVAWREEVARVKRRAYLGDTYWGRPVPGFGPSDAAMALVGLAPAAHGGNRTGRAFTGDPSGDVLYAALHELGLASQATASGVGDGLELHGVRITMPVHCAPPDKKPSTTERDTCKPWLAREFELLRPTLRSVVVLGGFAWQALLPIFDDAGWQLPRPRPAFGHGSRVELPDCESGVSIHLIGSYHPSQRNVATKRLTSTMLVDVLRQGAERAGLV